MGLWRIDKIAPPVAKGCRGFVCLWVSVREIKSLFQIQNMQSNEARARPGEPNTAGEYGCRGIAHDALGSGLCVHRRPLYAAKRPIAVMLEGRRTHAPHVCR